jgi:hypothetical protein
MTSRSLLITFFLLLPACGGGGGGGGASPAPTPTPILPPPNTSAPSPASAGLVAAAAGSGQVRLDLRLPGTGFETALFQSTSAGTVYANAPILAPLAATSTVVSGLGDGVDTFFGLGVRAVGSTPWTPVGAVVRTRPGAPIYVDASASPAGANGQSPATAFPNLQDALLVAGAANGGNVWVRDGDYSAGPYALGPNVTASGGFDGSFTLANRNPASGSTRLLGTTTQEIVSVQTGGSDGALDGFVVDGGGTVLKGIDIVDGDVELRSLLVRRCSDRGIKAVNTVPTPNRRLAVIGCTVAEHGSDGLSSAGAIDVLLDGSHFDGNGQEGADIDDLACPDNGSVTLVANNCRFFGNGFEGLDADLAAVPLATGSGVFTVRLDNCRFEVNGLDGVLLDQEHEFFPGFRAEIVVRGCVARANRLAGLHIDADARGTYTLSHLRCTANGTDGVQVTSETNAGELVLTASWLAGNLGHGARVVSGNKVLLVSQCGIAGNALGGVRGDVRELGVGNSVFLRQPTPRTNASGGGNLDRDDGAAVFALVPTAWTTATANAQGAVTVASTTGFVVGGSAVAGDDGRGLPITQANGTTLVLDGQPTAFVLPGGIAGYATANVSDDLQLTATSPARSAGLTATGDPAPDAGPFGAAAGAAPGQRSPLTAATLNLLSTTPSLGNGIGAANALTLTFDRAVDPASVTSDRIVVLQNGSPVVVGLAVNGATVSVSPTGGGFTGNLAVRVLGGLRGADGSALAAALVLPLRVL